MILNVTLGQDPNYLRLKGMIVDQPFVATVTYNNGAAWPAEPSIKFSNDEVWMPAVSGVERVWNIPAEAVNRVLELESHEAEFYIGTKLHSKSLDAY